MVILEIFEGELVPISLDLDHLKSLKRTNFVPPPEQLRLILLT